MLMSQECLSHRRQASEAQQGLAGSGEAQVRKVGACGP